MNGWLDKARAAVGQPASSTAWVEGLGLQTEDAIAEALAADRELSEAVWLESSNTSIAGRGALLNGLTRRETEVLQMVAGGHTNREIASQLSLSVATVERHLATIYRKINARGRTEATAFAITRGLLAPARV